jgi:hypothetical protein
MFNKFDSFLLVFEVVAQLVPEINGIGNLPHTINEMTRWMGTD